MWLYAAVYKNAKQTCCFQASIISCHACSRALITFCGKLLYPRPVCCPCFPFRVFKDSSWFAGSSWTPAFCLTRGTGDMSERPPFSLGCIKLQPALQPARHQETLLDPYASASFAFGLKKDTPDSLFTDFYKCCRIHIIRTCYSLLSTVSVEFV